MSATSQVMVTDPDRLYFPAEIADVIGLSVTEISHLKKKGCPFYGRKTTVRWVRHFIAKEAGAPCAYCEPNQQAMVEGGEQ